MVRNRLAALVVAIGFSSLAQADHFVPPRGDCVALDRIELDHAARVTQAEIVTLERRLAAYEPMTRFKNPGPLVVTYDETRLALYERQLYLQRLQLAQRSLGRSRTW